jgi:hypothetical protein
VLGGGDGSRVAPGKSVRNDATSRGGSNSTAAGAGTGPCAGGWGMGATQAVAVATKARTNAMVVGLIGRAHRRGRPPQ